MAAAAGLLSRNLPGALLGRGIVGSLLRPTVVAANTLQPCRGMAARKGTREKARKKKVKVEVQKVVFDPLSQRDKRNRTEFKPKMVTDAWKQVATDDIFPGRYYQRVLYSFEEAIEMHRETHHPTVYNKPDALVKIFIECDLTGERKTKFLDKLNGNANVPHLFDQQIKRTILMFSKNPRDLNAGLEAGAALVGGPEVIKGIQTGDVAIRNVNYVVSTPELVPELSPIRGLIRLQFPNARNGTISETPVEVVKKLMKGVEYSVQKDDREPEYGWCHVNIGTLDMPTEQLKENMMAVLNDIKSKATPKRVDYVIWRLRVICPPGGEEFILDLSTLPGLRKEAGPPKETEPAVSKESAADAEEENVKVAAKQ